MCAALEGHHSLGILAVDMQGEEVVMVPEGAASEGEEVDSGEVSVDEGEGLVAMEEEGAEDLCLEEANLDGCYWRFLWWVVKEWLRCSKFLIPQYLHTY